MGFTKRVKRKLNKGEFILSVYFHSPDKELFEFCIKWLKKNDLNFLSQEDVYAIFKKSKPFPKSSVIITVDDGWQTNEENIVRIANQYNIPIAIFVSTDAIENGNFWWSYVERAAKMKISNYSVKALKRLPDEERKKIICGIKKIIFLPREAMTLEQVKKIASFKYITIGSNTVYHPILFNCVDEQVRFELAASKQKIEEWTNKPVIYFAYPNGNYSDREIKYLKEIGYVLAYTTRPVYLKKQNLQNVYELPRFSIFENTSRAEAICRMLGVWQSLIKSS
jgi:peptidoglycan/xylan/chitin deacetylase (PgdA/CDA1 family)